MLTETFRSLAAATRNLFRNWQTLLLIAIVYAALLTILYLFVWVKEATYAQVSLTFAAAVAVPLLFFVLQAMIAGGGASASDPAIVTPTAQETAGFTLKRSLANFWKLFLITLPLIGLAMLVAYLLNKAQGRWGLAPEPVSTTLRSLAAHFGSDAKPVTQLVKVDRKRLWKNAGNITKNAAIGSAIHLVKAPVRAMRRSQ